MLRYTYSVSSVPFYIPSLCTSTVCSVYRVLSVIMCSSVLIPPSSRGNCSAVWDAVSLQYTCTECSVSVTCTSRYRTHVYVRRYCVEIVYVILAKRRKNVRLKSGNEKWLEERRINIRHHLEWMKFGDVFWIGCLEMEVIERVRKRWVCQQAGGWGDGDKMSKDICVRVYVCVCVCCRQTRPIIGSLHLATCDESHNGKDYNKSKETPANCASRGAIICQLQKGAKFIII